MVYEKEILVGVFRYRQVAGSIYVRYNEHSKKVVGLAQIVSGNFVPCGANKLSTEIIKIERESEGKRK